ncbi:hypothetical protein BI364_10040 [Acidihalobacter yilgarnensis]|uniref:Uncharacterized protein n=1 Tax=Acidihalobacter yilgarnensis TaxID=2819280 RepID=A0A1D8IPF1_9GAMM|nr:hypothetical protein [Acidihalobacter yilgarnensis]AOU98254.1 hypothetical protein BI364_10040 [Acidihalobacter yilgarnensis]
MYPFPENTNQASMIWNDIQNERRESEPERLILMAVITEALDEGLFYTTDVFSYVEKRMGETFAYPNDPELKSVENGIRGMEVYYARRCVEQWRADTRNEVAAATLNVRVGQKYRNLQLGSQRFSSGVITARFPKGQVKLLLTKRGSKHRYEATVGAASLMDQRA